MFFPSRREFFAEAQIKLRHLLPGGIKYVINGVHIAVDDDFKGSDDSIVNDC